MPTKKITPNESLVDIYTEKLKADRKLLTHATRGLKKFNASLKRKVPSSLVPRLLEFESKLNFLYYVMFSGIKSNIQADFFDTLSSKNKKFTYLDVIGMVGEALSEFTYFALLVSKNRIKTSISTSVYSILSKKLNPYLNSDSFLLFTCVDSQGIHEIDSISSIFTKKKSIKTEIALFLTDSSSIYAEVLDIVRGYNTDPTIEEINYLLTLVDEFNKNTNELINKAILDFVLFVEHVYKDMDSQLNIKEFTVEDHAKKVNELLEKENNLKAQLTQVREEISVLEGIKAKL